MIERALCPGNCARCGGAIYVGDRIEIRTILNGNGLRSSITTAVHERCADTDREQGSLASEPPQAKSK